MQKNKGRMIVCYGDSNTYGYDPCVPGGGRYAKENRWPALVEKKTRIPVKNCGLCGRKIPRYESQFQCVKEQIEAWSLEAEEISLLLISTVPVKHGTWVENQKICEETEKFACYDRKLSEKYRIDFADAGEWKIPLAYDGVHFTEEGHSIFAENIIRYVK